MANLTDATDAPVSPVYTIRRRQGMTLSELARRAGVTRMTVYKIEDGRPARAETYCRLARALGVDVSILLTDVMAAVPA